MTKPKQPETKREMEERHIRKLSQAWSANKHTVFHSEADRRYAELRAAVYAVVPGKQKAANIRELLDQAVTAVCRVIRRRK